MGIRRHIVPGHERLNPILLESIYRLKTTDPGAKRRTSVGGWHSTDPLIVTLPGFDHLMGVLQQEGVVSEIWAIVNGKGHSNRRHAHWAGVPALSAVYYVQVPQPRAAIVFDPGIRIEPEPGLLLVFGSDEQHSVEVNGSDQDRVVVACNFVPAPPR